MATRAAVGAAESGASPIILPLLTDIFPVSRRSFAMGLLYIGVPLGGLLANGVGAYVAAEHGWRMALLLAGIPGIVLAVLVLLVVRDPGRGAVDNTPAEPTPKIMEVLGFLVRSPAILCIILAGACIGLISIALGAWTSSFYIRVHGLGLKQVGLIIGLAGGACGLTAPPLFGWLADRAVVRSPILPLTITWMSGLAALAVGMVWLFSPFLPVVIVCGVLCEFLRQGYPPMLYPVVMGRTPARMRGAVMSVIQFTTNLIGYGFGPVFLGLLSDLYGGGKALRFAMANALGVYGVIIALLIAASVMLRKQARS